MECIILAGGLGTRLRATIGDYPKCMAPVNGKPFLHYIFQYLQTQSCSRIILSLGYKHEIITEWLSKEDWNVSVDLVIENEPLGTGGGIQLAIQRAKEENVVVLNGDTFFDVDLKALFAFHENKQAATTLALRFMQQFVRYGSVNVDEEDRIVSFEEKKFKEDGLINGGVYVINKKHFLEKDLPEKFSFEKDYLEAFVHKGAFYGKRSEGYFIDIGIPEDFEKAQKDLNKIV
ncbi:MAG TPA: nucleotidyltransferase family protein [Flavipsychrobacter sp.]|nr:nucleotidyltransferase family protein [Flavipsychrobacter sp.]